jgi:hypothetical protein
LAGQRKVPLANANVKYTCHAQLPHGAHARKRSPDHG